MPKPDKRKPSSETCKPKPTGKKKPKAAEPPAAATPRDPLAQVLQWVLAGQSERDILTAIKAHWPDKDPPAIIAAVIDDIEKSASASPDVLIGWCFEATRDLYRRMVEIGDFPGALRAVKQIMELTRNVHSGTEADDEDAEQPEGQAEGELPDASPEGGRPAA